MASILVSRISKLYSIAMSHASKVALNQLIQGIATQNVQFVRDAWRELLNEPQTSSHLVCKQLRSDAWLKKPVGLSAVHLGVLLTLLHTLDAELFRNEVAKLRAEPLHAAHTQTIEMIERRYSDRVFGKIGDEVPVYISQEIDQPELIFTLLQRWSKTRDLAFSNVTRVDVIALRSEMDYLGRYNLYFNNIILTWQNEVSSVPAQWWRKICTEWTFYHEVGHHFYQHRESGQIEEQEQEAEDYAWRVFLNAHPILKNSARLILLPILITRKLSKYLAKIRDKAPR